MPNNNVIELVIEAQDNATAVLDSVAQSISDAAQVATAGLQPVADAASAAAAALPDVASAGIGAADGIAPAGEAANNLATALVPVSTASASASAGLAPVTEQALSLSSYALPAADSSYDLAASLAEVAASATPASVASESLAESLIGVGQAAEEAVAPLEDEAKQTEEVSKKSKEASKETVTLKDAFNKLKGAAGALGVALGAAAIFNKFITAAGESQLASVRLDLAYRNLGNSTGQTRKQLDDFAKSIQKTTTFTDEQVSGMQEVLFRFGSVSGETFVRAQRTVVDLAAAMNTDLPSAAHNLGRALEDPERGLMLLRRSGVILSEEQRTLVKDFQKAGDVASAQKIILDELDKRYSGTAETIAGTLTGSVDKLKIAYDDLFESTEGGASSFQELTEQMTAMLQDPNVKSGFDALFGLITEMTRLVGGAVGGWLMLGGAIKDALTPSEYSDELNAAWKQQSKAAAEYAAVLKLIADVKARPEQYTLPGQSGPNMAGYERRLAEAKKQLDAAQARVNRAEAADPVMSARARAAAQEEAEKTAAAAREKAAEKERAAEAKREEARQAAKKYAKEEAALVAQIKQDSDDTLAAMEQAFGAIRDAPPVTMGDLPTPEFDIPQLEEQTNLAQETLDKLTAPTLEAVKLDIEVSAGFIDPLTDEVRDLIIESENLVKTPIEKINDKYDTLRSAIQFAISKAKEGSEELAHLQELMGKLTEKQAQEIKDSGNDMTEFSKRAAQNMQDAFANFLFDPFKDGLKGMLKGFIDIMRQMIAQMIAAKIFKSLGFAALFGAAGGGIVPGNKPTVVGEEGPEVLVPTAKGAGAPKPSIVGAKGRQTLVPRVQSEVINKRQLPYVDDATKAAIMDSPARGLLLSAMKGIKGIGGSAGGGIIPANKPRLVGEEGPEIIVPTAQSQVINKRQLSFLDKKTKEAIGINNISAVSKQSIVGMTETSKVLDSIKKNAAITSIANTTVNNNEIKGTSESNKTISQFVSARNKEALTVSDKTMRVDTRTKETARNLLTKTLDTVRRETIGGSAGGGIIPPGKPRLVGEEGPEIILPTSNVRQLRSIEVSNADSQTLKAITAQMQSVSDISKTSRERVRKDAQIDSEVRNKVVQKVAKVVDFASAKNTAMSKASESRSLSSSTISKALNVAVGIVGSAKSSTKVVELASRSGKGSSGGGKGSSGKGSSGSGSGGGSAGGGIIPANAARLVGEDGPEIIVPTTQSNVVNARQLAFAGGKTANLNYSPSNTVVINGSADKETEAKFAAMMQYNNEVQMKQLSAMLYNNGFGRLR